MKITMKIPYLIVAITMFFTSLCFATENIALSASDQAQIEAQAKEMSTVGVPAEPARNMLTAMHQHQFTSQNIVRAQQEVMNCAKAGLPTEPVMNKASEGMAKKASEQQVIAAMQTVHSRYARANRMGVRLAWSDGAGFSSAGQLNLLSDFAIPGDIQMTGDGAPAVLLVEAQTTAGYPRLGTVLPCDLPRIAQASLGAPLQFERISRTEALAIQRKANAATATLKSRVKPLYRDPRDIPDLLSYQLVDGMISGQPDKDTP